MKNKTPIQHAFGVEPMHPYDLPGHKFSNFNEIVKVAMLHPEYIRPFFDMVVENCAKIAEEQGRVYDGSNKESAGCNAAAAAIRLFGKKDE